ncbi:serpin family protein [Prosthecobacter fluviatilis]|uniref:Serpin family protein n=1 Tax=Prosthecobacter fluviatilis TaxID=445931 RepID=A0ABW0KT16_9BACT
MRIPALALLLAASPSSLRSATPEQAAHAINTLGLDLHRQMPKQGNLCLSPFSIQSALAMTYLGASGVTQEEMARVLHFPNDKQAMGESFAALKRALDEAREASVKAVADAKKYGGPSEVTTLRVANQLFGQKGHAFRQPFRSDVEKHFAAPLKFMDFSSDPAGARMEINDWVAKQTRDRIRDLLPKNALTKDTRLVLTNALYFKASWQNEFYQGYTQPKPFHVNGGKETVLTPTMTQRSHLHYYNGRGFQAVTLPYAGGRLHFLLIVPDSINGIANIELKLTPELLLACAHAEEQYVLLDLPKFNIAPPSLQLGEMLQKLGMTTAFDIPAGSADFDAMSPRGPDDYLSISKVFHKTFLALDEKGTEAAAATVAEMMLTGSGQPRKKPLAIKADRPFLFAIQHAESGACLFLGRVTDPR